MNQKSGLAEAACILKISALEVFRQVSCFHPWKNEWIIVEATIFFF